MPPLSQDLARFRRFSLRTLFAGVTLVAIICGAVRWLGPGILPALLAGVVLARIVYLVTLLDPTRSKQGRPSEVDSLERGVLLFAALLVYSLLFLWLVGQAVPLLVSG